MSIEVRKSGDVCILAARGKLTIGAGASELRKACLDVIASGERRLVLNLEDVPFIDSAAIGETVACGKRAIENGGDFKLVLTPGGKPEQLLRLTRLDRVFESFAQEDEAIASFGGTA